MWPGRPPRLRFFSYRGCHRYLLTINTYLRSPWFADPRHANELSAHIAPFFAARAFAVLAYCVMPDHVHLVLEGVSADADLRESIRAWKSRTGYEWRRSGNAKLWQTGFHDRVLREEDDTRAIVRYVLENPVRAGLVRSASDYKWLGSSSYSVAELAAYAGDWTPEWKRSRRV
jgi:putative transposase